MDKEKCFEGMVPISKADEMLGTIDVLWDYEVTVFGAREACAAKEVDLE